MERRRFIGLIKKAPAVGVAFALGIYYQDQMWQNLDEAERCLTQRVTKSGIMECVENHMNGANLDLVSVALTTIAAAALSMDSGESVTRRQFSGRVLMATYPQIGFGVSNFLTRIFTPPKPRIRDSRII